MSVPFETKFRTITDHKLVDGVLSLFVEWFVTKTGLTNKQFVLFDDLKNDEGIACAKYIRQHVVEGRRGRGMRPLNQWASNILKHYSDELITASKVSNSVTQNKDVTRNDDNSNNDNSNHTRNDYPIIIRYSSASFTVKRKLYYISAASLNDDSDHPGNDETSKDHSCNDVSVTSSNDISAFGSDKDFGNDDSTYNAFSNHNDFGNDDSRNQAFTKAFFNSTDYTTVIEDMSKLSGSKGPLFWLHVGISSENTMIDKIMSAAIIADYIYRAVMEESPSIIFQQQMENVVHPFSSLIDTNYDPLLTDRVTITKSKIMYNELRINMRNNIGIKFDEYDTYLRKVNVAKVLILRFTKMCVWNKLVVGNPKQVFDFVRDKSPLLVKMLEGKTKSFLSNKHKILEEITVSNFRLMEVELDLKLPSNLKCKPKSKPKPKKGKKGWQYHKGATHPDHKKADNNINSRKSVVKKSKPGCISFPAVNIQTTTPPKQKENLEMDGKMNELIFDGVSKEVHSIAELPVIVIETFKDKAGKIVCGIGRSEKNLKPGESYMGRDTYENKELTDVTICSTTSSYFYVFSEAEKKPHFVLSHSEALKYHFLVTKHGISNRFWFDRSLDYPIKLLSDHSITNGLRSGNEEESGFYFFSNRTEEFKLVFHKDNIRFKLDYYMIIFDEQEFSGGSTDVLKRGFTTHLDLGWSREGASSSTEKSQKSAGEIINATPAIMGMDEHFYNLGNLPDLIMTMTNGVVFDNATKLMPDNDRDEQFAALLRQKMKCKMSRFEAFTIVRQKVCVVGDTNSSGFQGTARHIDGPNDTRTGYRHTCVFSFLAEWNHVSK